jgi:hypothetical protein
MSAQTATRYTCADCRKTYRSFRTEEEWRASHVADVCTAQGVARAPQPVAPPVAHAAPVAPPAQPTPAAPPAEDGPWWQSSATGVAASAVAALLLLYVAFDGFRIMSDATDAGPKALQLLIAAVIALPCLFGVYQLGRSAVLAVQPDR